MRSSSLSTSGARWTEWQLGRSGRPSRRRLETEHRCPAKSQHRSISVAVNRKRRAKQLTVKRHADGRIGKGRVKVAAGTYVRDAESVTIARSGAHNLKVVGSNPTPATSQYQRKVNDLARFTAGFFFARHAANPCG